MPIKIKETTERWCCEYQDLKPYKGDNIGADMFCKHCGQLWVEESCTDAAGGRETILIKFMP